MSHRSQKIQGFSRAGRQDEAGVAALRKQLKKQQELIDTLQAELKHSRKIFDRASAAARIGVWECELPAETLRWTDVVYDIFDLPRDFDITRGKTLALYSEESARELKRLRDKAIEERSGFTMDAEIVTEKGNKRWMRITATVECDGEMPQRIFGMKQDITEEKNLADRTRYLAEFDVLTGLANRSRFQSMLAEVGEIVFPHQRADALLLIDMDGFKSINDSYGHAAGDDCLKEAGQRLLTICEDARLVSRIGGDEFAV
ncbi:diguanylate cyclase domain-containing protein [Oryzicola mucosus]|uniref:diguanylate cyclase domain-containing protein n=1 Tax=Oryzicola mucosus TaxID=2767425 RepID=UPI0022AAF942|nr:diguanylate cyclase [Oryzicola mucosus]